VFVDAKVFLRFLTDDVPEQAAAARSLLERAAQGDVGLTTSAMVVAELVWVMESYYGLPREQVYQNAMAVVLMDGMALPEEGIVVEALAAYMDLRVDFVDAFNAGWMRAHGLSQIATFGTKHMKRLGGLVSVDPGAV
jgi:predicted nucleic-acid-binding protein